MSQALRCDCRMNAYVYGDFQIHFVICMSIVQCVLKCQAKNNLLHLMEITCGFFLLLVMRSVDGGHMGGSEHIHQEEGGWLGFGRNLQALGVAQGGLGQGLQHWGGPLGWPLSNLTVKHKLDYSHKIETQHPHMPFELWLKSQHVLMLSVHGKKGWRTASRPADL